MQPNEMITISQFKATCLSVLDKVQQTGQPVIVTRHGKPLALITPPPPAPQKKWLGAYQNRGIIVGDILSPVTQNCDWEVLHD
jgi:prevent-host-death family protein